jgi:hypothetical protein
MSVLPTPPTQIIKQIDAQLYTFLWSNKTERIKRVILQNTKQSGGVSMPDIILKDKGLKISWAKRLVQSNYLAECMYISTWITNIDIWKCNLNPSDINVLFRKKPNKYNRDIFSAWSYYSYNTPDTSLEIMNQFIWFNSHIRIDGKPTFNNRMYTAGIQYVKQLLDQNGNILNYQYFIQKYGINVNFLNYLSIINAIPPSWKVTLFENNNDDNHTAYTYSIDKIINVKSKICKIVYAEMQQSIVQEPINVFDKWRTFFHNELTMEEWLNSFDLIFHCTNFVELHFFHFKMLHQILANNEALYKWTLTQSDLCSFCNEEIETIYHTYLECEVTKQFWKELETYVYSKLRVRIPITNQEIILGCKGDELSHINVIYLLAKKYLYQCRCRGTFPRIETFIAQLHNLIDTEKGIYVMKNQYDRYLNRWGELANK